jgi:hypothetical protein
MGREHTIRLLGKGVSIPPGVFFATGRASCIAVGRSTMISRPNRSRNSEVSGRGY